MPVGVDEMRKIADHVLNKIAATTLAEPQHGEIAVSIVEFAKTRAWNHVRLRKREQRRMWVDVRGLARELVPERINVFAKRCRPGQVRNRGSLRGQIEMVFHKALQLRLRLGLFRMIQAKDFRWRRFRDRVCKFLAVRKDPFHLHPGKEILEYDLRRIRIWLGRRGSGP